MAWTLVLDWLCLLFRHYAGKCSSDQAAEFFLGLDGKIVIDLLNNVVGDYYAVIFDNFFTSFDLLSYLKKMDILHAQPCKKIARATVGCKIERR